MYGHTIATVLEQERYENIDAVNLWNLPELSKLSQKMRMIKYEGIYSFGGVSEMYLNSSTNSTNNDVRVLSFEKGEK